MRNQYFSWWPVVFIAFVVLFVVFLGGVTVARIYDGRPAIPEATVSEAAEPPTLTETSGPLEIYADRGMRAPFRIVDRELGVACYGQWGTSVSCVKLAPAE